MTISLEWVTDGFFDAHSFNSVAFNITCNFEEVMRLAATKRKLRADLGERFFFAPDQMISYEAKLKFSWNKKAKEDVKEMLENKTIVFSHNDSDEETRHKLSLTRGQDEPSPMSLSRMIFVDDFLKEEDTKQGFEEKFDTLDYEEDNCENIIMSNIEDNLKIVTIDGDEDDKTQTSEKSWLALNLAGMFDKNRSKGS